MAALTPMMQQWHEAKSAYPDCILLFRMGDFYELFDDDAVEAARVLELTLTSRDKDKENGQPMAGVPHHAVAGYIQRLLELGYRVAICDQMEDPKQAKGIVKRGVTRVVTPGTVIDDVQLDPKSNNYLAAIWPGLGGYGVVYADISTGDLRGTVAADPAALGAVLFRVEAREVIAPPELEDAARAAVQRVGAVLTTVAIASFDPREADAEGHVRRPTRARKGVPDELRRALGGLEAYLARTRPTGAVALGELEVILEEGAVSIDETSFRNLELVRTLVGGRRKGSLLGLVDRTVTAMGARQLRRWLELPLRDKAAIETRLDAVEELLDDAFLRDDIRTLLGGVYDLERLGGRLVAGVASPTDLANLRQSVAGLGRLRERVSSAQSARLRALAEALDPLEDIHARLVATLADPPAQSPDDGRVIREGFDAAVDQLVSLAKSGKDWIADYQSSERARTGISSLKVSFNRVFGYTIEVTRANLELVPKDYIRKQTISTGERFYTVELKEYETNVLTAEEQRVAREKQLFDALRLELREKAARVLRAASRVADLDVLAGLAELAHRRTYTRPSLHEDGRLVLRQCRHPVVEDVLPAGQFVPNDIELHQSTRRLLLITGPNMAGKSTIMRQVALVTLMAQIGSFVPAQSAEIGLVDRIFTRVGATDDLSRGQSTFMVEMSETAHILRYATSRSLVILDEIGRGTSTFDGLSIAWAVAEHLNDVVEARTLFATHYHELTELSKERATVANVHVAVREWNDEIVFLRLLRDGATNRSYGIQVGRLAGLPESVVGKAREVLARLEQSPHAAPEAPKRAAQLGLFGEAQSEAPSGAHSDVVSAVARFDVNRSTPLEALRLLDRLQARLRKS